jgi:hypothetical protein
MPRNCVNWCQMQNENPHISAHLEDLSRHQGGETDGS